MQFVPINLFSSDGRIGTISFALVLLTATVNSVSATPVAPLGVTKLQLAAPAANGDPITLAAVIKAVGNPMAPRYNVKAVSKALVGRTVQLKVGDEAGGTLDKFGLIHFPGMDGWSFICPEFATKGVPKDMIKKFDLNTSIDYVASDEGHVSVALKRCKPKA